MEYDICIDGAVAQGIPEFRGRVGRVNVILGANGSGKSKLLTAISATFSRHFPQPLKPVYVEGGRTTNLPFSVAIDHSTMNYYQNPESAANIYKSPRTGTLSSRIAIAFILINLREKDDKAAHSDLVEQWRLSGSEGPAPERAETPLSKLFSLFKGVFPSLELSVNSANQLVVNRNGAVYPPTAMSDGEKQVLSLLADIAVLDNTQSVFLIDEPELNLHPSLAEALWTSLEDTFPENVFIYTTHNLSFALRPNVEEVYIIGSGMVERETKPSHSSDLRPFLGSMPGIIHFQKCLFVEGQEISFDAAFYRWILKRTDIGVFAIGSCSDVVAATKREGMWRQISSGITLRGVVDLDFTREQNSQETCMLALHEAESYLCHPDLVTALQASLGNVETARSRDEVIDYLVDSATKRILVVVAQRVFKQLRFAMNVSLERESLSSVRDVARLVEATVMSAHDQIEKAGRLFSADAVTRLVEDEFTFCQEAVDTRNVDTLLRIFEGKAPLYKLCTFAGCSSPGGMMRALTKHHKPTDFAHTNSLVEQLSKLFPSDNGV